MPLKLVALSGLVLLLATTGCAKKDDRRAPPTPEAGYVVLTAQSAPIEIELTGRTSAYDQDIMHRLGRTISLRSSPSQANSLPDRINRIDKLRSGNRISFL